MTLRGASPSTVRAAIETRDPLAGTAGFAGRIDDVLVRDVLGRVPLYVDRSVRNQRRSATGIDLDDGWAFDPTQLADPVLVPSGTVGRVDALRGSTVTDNGPPIESVDCDAERSADYDAERSPDFDAERSAGTGGIDADLEQVFDRRWTLPNPSPADPVQALDALDDALVSALDDVTDAGVAVAFSGGVDSALVAAFVEAPLYVIGFPDSHDVEAARTAAEAMGRELNVISLDPDDLRAAVPSVSRAIGRTNAMDVSIALPLYLLARRVAADGHERLALGQGADELFGGYEKVVHLDHRVDADTVRGAVREGILTVPTELPRDVHAVEAGGVDPVTPYLHDSVVDAALRLPEALLADDDQRKIALRTVASRYLPPSVAAREKKALQYGSLVSRELDRLARQAGYKRRLDDHVGQYIESRLETA